MTIATSLECDVELPSQLVVAIEQMVANTGGRIIIVDDSSRLSFKAGSEPTIKVGLWYNASEIADAILKLAPDSIDCTPRRIRSFALAAQTADVIVATYDNLGDDGRIMIDVLPATWRR